MKSKKTTFTLIFIAIIVILIAFIPTIKNEIAYREAKSYLRAKDYQASLDCFFNLGEYRESREFFFYTKAIVSYEANDFSSASAHLYDVYITDDEFKEEAEDFIIKVKKAYDNYIIEKKKEAKKEKEREKREIVNKIPYVGMSVEYLNKTKLGSYGDYFTNRKIKNGERVEYKVYSWYSKSGILIMRASVEYSRVTSVNKFNEATCWDGDNLKYGVLPGGTKKAKTYKKQTTTAFEDEYNVNDYSNEDDFYYDHYDDFYDYYDAEDYYREHHE